MHISNKKMEMRRKEKWYVGLIIILALVLCLNVVWHNFVIFARYWDLGDIFLH